MARNININLEGKDNVSPALKNASARLVELRSEIDKLRAKGEINLTVADTRNLTKLTSEANRLERALGGVATTGTQGANSLKGAFGGLSNVLSGLGLGGLTGVLSGAGFAAAAVKVGSLAVELGNLGAQALVTEDSFDAVLRSVGANVNLLDELQTAAGGTISDLRLMQLTNTALAGASGNVAAAFAEAIPKLIEGARAANQLNPALGDTEFLFQSLVTGIKRGSPMLIDNTGITLDLTSANQKYAESIGKTVDQLTEEEKQLALINATMAGADRLVQQTGGNLNNMTTSAQQLTTAWANLRAEIGKGLAPATAGAQAALANMLTGVTDALSTDAVESYDFAVRNLADAEAYLASVKDRTSAMFYADYDSTLQAAQASRDKAAADAEVARVMVDVARGAYSTGSATLDMAERLRIATTEAYGLADGLAAVNSATGGGTDWTAKAYSVAMQRRYAGITGAQSAEQEEYGRAMALLRTRQTRINMETEANAEIADDYVRSMKSAVSTVASEITSAFSAAQSASKGLFDFTKGAGDMFAPGSNGPFEAIYRAQAVAVGGIETDQERQWAEMYGLTPESAARIVADFQRGLFTQDVTKLINVDQLVGQIQSEQAAAQSKTAFANMIAGKLGVQDAGALVASQTFQAIAGGVEADPAQQANAAQKVLDAYLNNVNTVVTGKDYAGRMIGFGSTTWIYYEQGLLEGAKESAVFAAAVDAAIGAWMARQAAPKQQGVVGTANSMGVTP